MPTEAKSPVRHNHRWLVTLKLTAATPLAIGDGNAPKCKLTPGQPALLIDEPKGITTAEADSGVIETHVNTVATDHSGQPYVPGSSLKGALRSAAKARLTEAALNALFGYVDDSRVGNQRDDESIRQTGAVDFRNAYFDAPREAFAAAAAAALKNQPYASAARATYVETGIHIDRDRGTVTNHMLYNSERVHAGAAFTTTLFVDHANQVEGEQLMARLIALCEQLTVDGGLKLGADTGQGLGRVAIQPSGIKYFGESDFDEWRTKLFAGPWSDYAKPCSLTLAKENAPTKPSQTTSSITLSLNFTGLYLINDPNRVSKATDSAPAVAHAARIDAEGKPMLPASTLRGALRGQSERILRTLGLACCGAGGTASCANGKAEKDFCLACHLYGNTRQAARLRQSTPKCTSAGTPHTQDFVAIDRFTGGGQDGLKFNAQGFYQPSFDVTFELAHSTAPAAIGVLLLTLRDLAEGDIPLGWGKRKGYGACTATGSEGVELAAAAVTAFAQGDSSPALAVLRASATTVVHSIDPTNPVATKPLPPAANPSVVAQQFHNTYHFVPADPTTLPAWAVKANFENDAKWLDDEALGRHSHARYRARTSGEPTFSGRLHCTLTTVLPVFVGGRHVAQRDNQAPYPVPNYRLGGRVILPATSIKGMLSTISEVASGSAMRVFDHKRELSYRKSMADVLSPVGRIVAVPRPDGRTTLSVQPLCPPVFLTNATGVDTLESTQNWARVTPSPPNDWLSVVGLTTPELKWHIGNYVGMAHQSVRDASGFLSAATQSYRDDAAPHDKYYWLRVPDTWDLHVKAGARDQRSVIGQKSSPHHATPISEATYNALSVAEQTNYRRGIIRVLGRFGEARKSIPNNKKHELFLDFPEGIQDLTDTDMNPELFAITPAARNRFRALAAEANEREDYLPYAPQGTRHVGQGVVDVKLGDLVFFKLGNNSRTVSEFSYSMIWRGRLEHSDATPITMGDFFKYEHVRYTGPDRINLLPFHRHRTHITPAEFLFGFVENNGDDGTTDNSQALAYAGKLRISDALPVHAQVSLEPPVVLKILAAPKLNAATYFKPRGQNTGHIMKSALTPDLHEPLGVKLYTHARSDANERDLTRAARKVSGAGYEDQTNGHLPWASHNPTEEPKQRVAITPISAGEQFRFHIDLNELSLEEMQLLCFSLHPDDAFRHKLGMGKPLGLGSVAIKLESFERVERTTRYRYDDLTTARSNVDSLQTTELHTLASQYANDPRNAASKEILRTIGDPSRVRAPVHAPLALNQMSEHESFKWFVHNDDQQRRDANLIPRQSLGAVAECSLPILKRLDTHRREH